MKPKPPRKDDLEMDGLKLPNIPIKIIRQGEKLKFEAGEYILELKPINGTTQTYSLLVLDKFISEITMKLVKEEIENRENRAAAKKSLQMLGVDADDAATDNVIKQIHEGMFPESEQQ